VAELVPSLADGLQPLLDRPFAFFGHSMGALVAFELARELRRRAAPAPFLLGVSGYRAPHRPDPHPPFSHLPDPEFLQEVCARYDGIPPEVLAEKELLELMLPVLRTDILALEGYVYSADRPLDCPVSSFGGEDDPSVSREDLGAWRDQTQATFSVRTFPGRHFFIDSARGAVLQAVRDDLRVGTLKGER
jgi:surfactin synthase thioesterase subunit